MAQTLKALNSKETKGILESLQKQYGFTGHLELAYFMNEKKERVYVFTRDIEKIDAGHWRIDTMGLYFGTYYEGQLRLTIEATQMLGPLCTKHILDITKEELDTWMMGEKLALSTLKLPQEPVEPGAFVIMRYRHDGFNDYVGCGKIGGDVILNYVPKTRYIHAKYDSPVTEEVDSSEDDSDEDQSSVV